MSLRNILCWTLVSYAICLAPQAAPLAFPGADGFGRYASGGRGGRVYVVNRLDDHPVRPARGSLRHAINGKGKRTIVFAVSGIIELQGELNVSNGDVTIAGQSSPGGIAIAGAPVVISADNVIVRFVRFRGGRGTDEDVLAAYNSHKVIIDHVSVSWGGDETASFYHNEDFTLQYSIISHALNREQQGGNRGFGGIWGGAGASFHHNLLAHNAGRNPRVNGWRMGPPYARSREFIDLRNNVVYNWWWVVAYGNELGQVNVINNYYRTGPATADYARGTYFKFYPEKASQQFGRGYFSGNVLDDRQVVTLEAPRGITLETGKQNTPGNPEVVLANAAFDEHIVHWFSQPPLEKLDSAADAYQTLVVAGDVGANRRARGWFHDSVDRSVLEDVRSRGAHVGNGIISDERELIGSWQQYQAEFADEIIDDKDGDGMPDAWETAKAVRKPGRYDLHRRYTNLEMYLNEIAQQSSESNPAGP